MADGTCEVSGCGRAPRGAGNLCNAHRIQRARGLPFTEPRTVFRDVHRAFWSRVAKGGECWLWTGSKTSAGYGQFGPGGTAHRRSYEIHKGPIPAGMFVMHSCDNPPCVNPAHLSLGTSTDNNRDMVSKGRSRGRAGHGTLNCNAKLTPEKVVAIRRLAAEGRDQREIGRQYGISQAVVWHVFHRKTWKHVA